MGIIIKSRRELAKMREAGKIVCAVLDAVEAACVPGVTTAALNRIAQRILEKARAKSAFLGYRQGGSPPFPAVLCTSLNRVVVHGIPSEHEVLREGDLIGIDFACFKDGYCADAARSLAVGVVSAAARDLIATTRECLERAVQLCVAGQRLGDLGAAIQECAEEQRFSIVREFVGHGIGQAMHEPPAVPNFGVRGQGAALRAGMVLAIEPMLNARGPEVSMLADGWTVVTDDGSDSAHFEHSVAITSDGPVVLTAG